MTENGKPKYFTLDGRTKRENHFRQDSARREAAIRESVYSTIFPQPAYGAKGT